MEPLAFLRAHPPFDTLEAAGLRAVGESLEVVYLPRGTSVLHKDGTPSTHLFVIRKGSVSLMRDGQVVQLLEEGDCFGFPSLIARAAPTADVVAAEDTLCYRLPGKVFDALMADRGFADFFLADLSQRVRSAAAARPPALASDLATPLARVARRPALLATEGESVRDAACRMTEAAVSSLVIVDPAGAALGIVTDKDLRARVVAAGLDAATPLARVMTRGVRTLPSTATLFDALVFMLERDLKHVPVEEEGRVAGMVTSGDLVRLRTHDPLKLLHALQRGVPPGYGRELTAMIDALAAGGLDAPGIARVVSRLNDALVGQLIRRARDELGRPPCEFAWIVFGSEGRMEQLLSTDQDNALVYETASEEAAVYFARLAEHVVGGLIEAGFPPCPGGYMATRWTRSLAELEGLFAGWLARADGKALLEAASFFDFRAVAGELRLDALHELVRSARGSMFVQRLAGEALRWRPPLGLFRQIRAEAGGVDLKAGGIYPVVSLARVLALDEGSDARPTLDRLAAAAAAGTLSQEGAATLGEAFRFLLGLRLRAQLAALRAGRAPSNSVDPKALAPLERRYLKDTFQAIAHVQSAVAYRYLSRVG